MSAKSKYTVKKNKLNKIESHADPHDSVKVNTSLKISDNLNFSLQSKVVKCHVHVDSQKHGIYDT